MPLSRFLGCFMCGDKDEAAPIAAVPVKYEIEGKKPTSELSTPSDSCSEADFPKVEKVPTLNVVEFAPTVEVATPRTNRALVVASKGTYALQHQPFPELEHDMEVVIRNYATGLNPIDFKSVDYNFCLPEFPWVTGREMAGTIEHVGAGVKNMKVGDRVWTSTYYRDRRAGCFQEYVTVPAHTVLPIPSNLSFEQAACLGVAALTAAMSLWCWLQIPILKTPTPNPDTSEEYLLIWGGSAITGQFAIQIAHRCSIKVLAVTSSKTRALAESLGAQVIVRDGKTNEEIVNEIRGIAGDNITRAIDLVGTTTAAACLTAMSQSKPSLFAPLAMISSKAVVPANIVVETVEMKQFVLKEESRQYAIELNRLIEEGQLVLPNVHVIEGGLDVVEHGLNQLKGGDMGGVKMVVKMI